MPIPFDLVGPFDKLIESVNGNVSIHSQIFFGFLPVAIIEEDRHAGFANDIILKVTAFEDQRFGNLGIDYAGYGVFEKAPQNLAIGEHGFTRLEVFASR